MPLAAAALAGFFLLLCFTDRPETARSHNRGERVSWPRGEVISIVVCLPRARSFEVSGEATARIIRAMTPAVSYKPADARLRISQAPEDIGGHLLVRYKDGRCDAVTFYLMGVNSLIYSINGEMVFRWYEDESDLADEHEEIYHHRGQDLDEALFFTGLLKDCFAELGEGSRNEGQNRESGMSPTAGRREHALEP